MFRIFLTQMNVFLFRATKFNALSSLDKRKDKSESSKTIKEDSDASNHREGKSSTAAGQKRKSALDDIMQVIIIDANATASTLTVCELRDKYDK